MMIEESQVCLVNKKLPTYDIFLNLKFSFEIEYPKIPHLLDYIV